MAVPHFFNLDAHTELEVISKINDTIFAVREKGTNSRFAVIVGPIGTTQGCPHCQSWCFRDWACECCEGCKAEFVKVQAPFTDDQVESLNAFQAAGVSHPFTCGNDSRHPNLIAHNEGWVCAECTYTQKWAHNWMTDWSWEQLFDFGD